jgi:hypothetical protein
MEILRIETSHPHIAQRIAEFAEQLGAIVKMPKRNKMEAVEEMDATTFFMSSEKRRTELLAAIERSKNPKNLVEVNLEDLKKQFGID